MEMHFCFGIQVNDVKFISTCVTSNRVKTINFMVLKY